MLLITICLHLSAASAAIFDGIRTKISEISVAAAVSVHLPIPPQFQHQFFVT